MFQPVAQRARQFDQALELGLQGCGNRGLAQCEFALQEKPGERGFELILDLAGDGPAGYGLFAFATVERGFDLARQAVATGDDEVDLQAAWRGRITPTPARPRRDRPRPDFPRRG